MLYQTKNPHGGDLYGRAIKLDYSANINPLGTPESVINAVVEATKLLCQYPDPYCRELVNAISEFENLPKDYILCGCGAAELIFSFCSALKPKKALELAPTFSEYSQAAEAVGCKVERYELNKENNFILDNGYIEKLKNGGYDLAFICNPNNPTGQTVPTELMTEIVKVCKEENIRLFVDECFLDLTNEEECHSLKGILKDNSHLFILKAFTKSYGMAGLRLGYCLSSDEKLLTNMGKTVQPWNVSIPAQMAGVAALKEVEFLKKAREIITEERQWLKNELEALGIKVCPSKTNYLLLYSEKPLKDLLLTEGIQIRDCSNYHGLSNGFYRIAVKMPEENKILIETLKKLI